MSITKKSGSWTICDIARMTGVSPKTVSRVVNNEAGVGPETRARVARIIAEVGYQPHTGARSMRSSKRDCIGLVIAAPVDEVPLSRTSVTWVLGVLYNTFGTKGNFICVDPSPQRVGPRIAYGQGLWQQRYSACVICGPLSIYDDVAPRIHASGHPYVAFGRLDSLPELSSATVDYELGAYQSTRYLLERGHRGVALIMALDNYHPGVERRRGYRRALEEFGLPYVNDRVRPVAFQTGEVTDAMHRVLLDPEVTAIVDCSATEDGPSLMEGARRAGRAPGRDFEIVCWTYSDRAQVLAEACAHVWIPVREAASEGLKDFARWYMGEREEPVHVLYRPILHEGPQAADPEKLDPLFDGWR